MSPVAALSLGLAVAASAAETPVSLTLDGRVEILWQADYATRPPGEYPQAVAVSASGDTVFIGGSALDEGLLREDYLALAFNAASGNLRWAARFDRSGRGDRFVEEMVPSPDGKVVFLTGTSRTSPRAIQTVAFAANDGGLLWSAREGQDSGGIAVDPMGERLYVTGSAAGPDVRSDVLYSAARDATSGAVVWRTGISIADRTGGFDVTPSPDGRSIYVLAAASDGSGSRSGHVARYDAATGAVIWTVSLDDRGAEFRIGSVTMSRDGKILFASGRATGPDVSTGVLRALDAEHGKTLWVRRSAGGSEPCEMAMNADGAVLFLGCCGTSPEGCLEALDAATGGSLWRAAPDGADGVRRIAVSSRGERVAILAEGDPSIAVFDAGAGTPIWSARYPADARAVDLAFDPEGKTLFVPSSPRGNGSIRIRVTAFRETSRTGEAASALPAP